MQVSPSQCRGPERPRSGRRVPASLRRRTAVRPRSAPKTAEGGVLTPPTVDNGFLLFLSEQALKDLETGHESRPIACRERADAWRALPPRERFAYSERAQAAWTTVVSALGQRDSVEKREQAVRAAEAKIAQLDTQRSAASVAFKGFPPTPLALKALEPLLLQTRRACLLQDALADPNAFEKVVTAVDVAFRELAAAAAAQGLRVAELDRRYASELAAKSASVRVSAASFVGDLRDLQRGGAKSEAGCAADPLPSAAGKAPDDLAVPGRSAGAAAEYTGVAKEAAAAPVELLRGEVFRRATVSLLCGGGSGKRVPRVAAAAATVSTFLDGDGRGNVLPAEFLGLLSLYTPLAHAFAELKRHHTALALLKRELRLARLEAAAAAAKSIGPFTTLTGMENGLAFCGHSLAGAAALDVAATALACGVLRPGGCFLWLDGCGIDQAAEAETTTALSATADTTGEPGLSLRLLSLCHNRLRILAMAPLLPVCAKLGVLRLNSNFLAVLPNEIGDLLELTELHCCDNQLRSLPTTLGKLRQLRVLVLDGNKLSKLPDACLGATKAALACLTTLSVRRNALILLPGSLVDLPCLKELHLDQNHITALPPGLCVMPRLQRLTLSCNQVSRLPTREELTEQKMGAAFPAAPTWPALREVDASENVLRAAIGGSWGSAPRLESLTLSRNRLECLSDGFGPSLPALRRLELADNRLTGLPRSLAEAPALERLGIAGNALIGPAWAEMANKPPAASEAVTSDPFRSTAGAGDLAILGLPPTITSLDLSRCGLVSMPPQLCKLSYLKSVLISGNVLPPALALALQRSELWSPVDQTAAAAVQRMLAGCASTGVSGFHASQAIGEAEEAAAAAAEVALEMAAEADGTQKHRPQERCGSNSGMLYTLLCRLAQQFLASAAAESAGENDSGARLSNVLPPSLATMCFRRTAASLGAGQATIPSPLEVLAISAMARQQQLLRPHKASMGAAAGEIDPGAVQRESSIAGMPNSVADAEAGWTGDWRQLLVGVAVAAASRSGRIAASAADIVRSWCWWQQPRHAAFWQRARKSRLPPGWEDIAPGQNSQHREHNAAKASIASERAAVNKDSSPQQFPPSLKRADTPGKAGRRKGKERSTGIGDAEKLASSAAVDKGRESPIEINLVAMRERLVQGEAALDAFLDYGREGIGNGGVGSNGVCDSEFGTASRAVTLQLWPPAPPRKMRTRSSGGEGPDTAAHRMLEVIMYPSGKRFTVGVPLVATAGGMGCSVPDGMTVLSLKGMIHAQEGFPAAAQVLLFRGRRLEDNEKLNDIQGLRNGAVLGLVVDFWDLKTNSAKAW